MSTKVFVTGAGGFIGSHLAETLAHEGFRVRAFVSYRSNGDRGWLGRYKSFNHLDIDTIYGDLRDYHSVRQAMSGCDAVLHLGALISIPYSYQCPESYIDVNVKGTLNVMQAARDLAVKKVIHTSTSEVYGSAMSVPISESHPLQGQSPYSASKIAADQLAFSFYSAFDLPVLIIRPFNTFGPRQSARAVIPTIILQIASGCKQLDLGNCATTRDFTYIDDTIRGFMAALNCEIGYGETINLGTGHEIMIGELVKTIAQEMGSEVEIIRNKTRFRPAKSEVERLCSDNSKAKSILGWSPRHSGDKGLREGLRKTIDWLLDSNNLALYESNKYHS